MPVELVILALVATLCVGALLSFALIAKHKADMAAWSILPSIIVLAGRVAALQSELDAEQERLEHQIKAGCRKTSGRLIP